MQASTVVTVLPPTIHIAIAQQSPQTFVGTPLPMVVLDVTDPDPISHPVITPDSWTSSDVSVATISSAGVVTPVAPGLTTLTATWRGAMDFEDLQVWAAPARFFYVAGSNPAGISGFKISIVPAVTEDRGETFIEQCQPTSSAPTPLNSSPSALTADPSGKFLFVASSQSNNVSAFSIDQTRGTLLPAPNSPFATGAGPVSAVVEAGGKYLYVANSIDNTISGYGIDASTGDLTPLTGFPVPVGLNPTAMAAVAGGFLYVVNSGSDSLSIFSINAATGAVVPANGSPFSTGHNPSAVAEYSSGNFVYVTNQSSNSISGFTRDAGGTFSELAGSPFPIYTNTPSCPGDQPLGAATDPQSPLLFVSFKQGVGGNCRLPLEAYDIDKTLGSLSNAAEFLSFTPGPQSAVAVDSSGGIVYFLDAGTNSVGLWPLNLGEATLISLYGGGQLQVGNTPVALQVAK